MSDICIIQRLTVLKEHLDKKDLFVSAGDVQDAIEQIQTLTEALAAKEKECEHLEEEINSKQNLITDMREGLQEIFSHYGEDEHIAAICNPLIEKSR